MPKMSEADQSFRNAINAGFQKIASITKYPESERSWLGEVLPVNQDDILLYWLNGEDEQVANLGRLAGEALGPWIQVGTVRYQSTVLDKTIEMIGLIAAGGHFVRSDDDELGNIDTMRLLTAPSPNERQVLDSEGNLIYQLWSMIATYEVIYTNRKD